MENKLSETRLFLVRQLEEEFNSKKMIFLIENPQKTEIDFIETVIEKLQHFEKEWERKCNLSDDEVHEETKKGKKYLNPLFKTATTDEAEQFFKYSLEEYRKTYKPRENENTRLIFYKTKRNLLQKTDKTLPVKDNKSLMLEGRKLNLSERYKIANEILDVDRKIRTLKIGELEKYQLLAYILGCDKDNARNLMNGTYKADDRDLTAYFNDLGLNK